jgi:hypothetical protein
MIVELGDVMRTELKVRFRYENAPEFTSGERATVTTAPSRHEIEA